MACTLYLRVGTSIQAGEEILINFIVCKQTEAHNGHEGPCLEGKRPRREACHPRVKERFKMYGSLPPPPYAFMA